MKFPVFILILLCPLAVIAQPGNLVPNPSFEDTIYCPTSMGQIDACDSWFQPTDYGSCDFYHSCSLCCGAGVPTQIVSSQPAQNGNGYAGLFTYVTWLNQHGGYREYIGVELNEDIIQGNKYYWCLYVSLLDSVSHACNNIGVALSNQKYEMLLGPQQLQVMGGVNMSVISFSTELVQDSINWSHLYGEFIAQGGEKFLYIGNFQPNSQTACTYVGTGSDFLGADMWDYSYYYVDNVYLGTEPCNNAQTDINQTDTIATLTIPNIFTPNSDGINDQFKLNYQGYTNVQYTIFNRWGIEVFTGINNQSWDGSINDTPAADGVYFLVITAVEQHTERTIIKTGTLQLVR